MILYVHDGEGDSLGQSASQVGAPGLAYVVGQIEAQRAEQQQQVTIFTDCYCTRLFCIPARVIIPINTHISNMHRHNNSA